MKEGESMGYMKIHCNYCGGSWEVYGRDDWNEKKHRTCPHCFSSIDGQDWHNSILPAFGAMMDANKELIKTHTGYNAPLFTVDYVEDFFFPDAKAEAETAVMNLQNSVDDLRETVSTLADAIITTELIRKGENI